MSEGVEKVPGGLFQMRFQFRHHLGDIGLNEFSGEFAHSDIGSEQIQALLEVLES